MNNTDRENALRDFYNFVMDEGTGMIREDDINAYLEYVEESASTSPTESMEGVKGERPNEKLLIELINRHITGHKYTKYNSALHYFEQVPVEKIADAMEAYAATHPTPESDIIQHLKRQREWSAKTFGPPEEVDRTEGVLDHMAKEIEEARENPGDVEEWIDLVMLAFDGAWRNGASPQDIAEALRDKLEKNESRDWPDWRESPPNKAIEHKPTPESEGVIDKSIENAIGAVELHKSKEVEKLLRQARQEAIRDCKNAFCLGYHEKEDVWEWDEEAIKQIEEHLTQLQGGNNA